MSDYKVASVIELIGESSESWEDAVKNVVETAAKTVHHISGVEVLNLTAVVEDGKVSRFKADVHLAFAIDDSLRKMQQPAMATNSVQAP